jgi:arylsulfatase A-like enzyme
MDKSFHFFSAIISFIGFVSNLNALDQPPSVLFCLSENHPVKFLEHFEEARSTFIPCPQLNNLIQEGISHPLAYCTDSSRGLTAFPFLSGKRRINGLINFKPSRSLAFHFKSLGYETVMFGSWLWKQNPDYLGFDSWEILDDPQIFINPRIKNKHGTYSSEGHTTDVITDLIIKWRKTRADNKPFFAFISYQSTNRPWIPPIRMVGKYNDEWFETPDSFFSDLANLAPASKYQKMNISSDLDTEHDLFLQNTPESNSSSKGSSIWDKNWNSMNDEQKTAWTLSWKPQNEAFARENPQGESYFIWKYQRFIKNYLRCLYAMDENIGRLIDCFKSYEKNNFQFIYSAERGRFIGEYGWFGSEWMYEPSSRIPLVIASFTKDHPLHLDTENFFEDFELFDLLTGFENRKRDEYKKTVGDLNQSTDKNVLFFSQNLHPGEYGVSPHHGFRKGKYKIIHYFPFNEWEFFDLENDPNEQNNLINQETLSDTIAEYKLALKNYADEVLKSSQDKMLYSEDWKRDQRSPKNKTR